MLFLAIKMAYNAPYTQKGNRENSVFSFYFVAGMLDYSIRVILDVEFPEVFITSSIRKCKNDTFHV